LLVNDCLHIVWPWVIENLDLSGKLSSEVIKHNEGVSMSLESKYSIQFVSRVSGVGVHSIRAWEKRYKALVPARDNNGRRHYSQEDLNRLVMLNALVEMGNNISDVASLPDLELKELYERFFKNEGTQEMIKNNTPNFNNSGVDIHTTLQNLVLALSHYKLDIISHELEKIKLSLTARDFALSILLPLLQEVKSQVAIGKLAKAQEQALSSIIRFHVGQILYCSFCANKKSDFNLTIVAPENEMNEFAILVPALLCSHYQINFFYLGKNLSNEAVADAVAQIKPNILLIGISDDSKIDHEPFLLKVRSEVNEKIPVWASGRIFNSKVIEGQGIQVAGTMSVLDQQLKVLSQTKLTGK
jgi:DNA-binding transcriptional MerR regulator